MTGPNADEPRDAGDPAAPRRVKRMHLLWFAMPVGFLLGDAAATQWGPWPGALIGGAAAGAVAAAISRATRHR